MIAILIYKFLRGSARSSECKGHKERLARARAEKAAEGKRLPSRVFLSFLTSQKEDIHVRKKNSWRQKLPKKFAKTKIIEECEAMTINHLERQILTG